MTSSTGETASPRRAMICVASSKHRSIRFARMWNSKSPGVETAWRAPARISRNTCNSAGRGGPKSRSHASDPKPMTQERPPSRSRNSTARNSAERSPQKDRTVARLSGPGFIVTTRKIAARVSGAATGWAVLDGACIRVIVPRVRCPSLLFARVPRDRNHRSPLQLNRQGGLHS